MSPCTRGSRRENVAICRLQRLSWFFLRHNSTRPDDLSPSSRSERPFRKETCCIESGAGSDTSTRDQESPDSSVYKNTRSSRTEIRFTLKQTTPTATTRKRISRSRTMKLSTSLLTATGLASATMALALPQAPPANSNSFVTTSGLNFVIDGDTGYVAGSNSYWIGFQRNNADVDLVLSHLRDSGLKVLRVWGFNDVNQRPTDGSVYFHLLENGNATINTGEDGLQRLDYVVSAAERYGIKLIVNFVNFWDDFGGMNAYVTAFGGSKAEFYTNSAIQTAFRAYVEAVVSRYRDSPAIFAWELANEPRCTGCNTDTVRDWVASTSQYIKSLDPNHLVGIGDEGFGLNIGSDRSYAYEYSEGMDFQKNLAVPSIDFGTLHLYPASWGVQNDWGNGWISSHGAACVAAGKPCLLEEYGVTSDHCTQERPWQTTALQTPGMAGDLFWQFGDQLSTGQSPNDGHTLYYGTSDYECLVTDHVAAIPGQ